MRKLLIFFVALFAALNCNAQHYKGLLTNGGELTPTPIPFAWEKNTPYLENPAYFDGRKHADLPLYTYQDLGGKVRNTGEEDAVTGFRYFALQGKEVGLLVLAIEKSFTVRHLLVTCKNGSIVDWIEGGISCNDDLAVKQWRVDEAGNVVVFSLKVSGERKVMFTEEFAAMEAAKEEVHYGITSDGKFYRTQTIERPKKRYLREQLFDKTLNLWDL